MKANRRLREFVKRNRLRLVTLAFETQRGGVVEFEGCVTIEDASRLYDILREIQHMCQKAERTGDR